jgi:coenzyme F420-0:L-glutamate ligase/coenzyme F420-1:gamma-L-glutamate ligase
MSHVTDAIRQRRSIRKYTQRPVPPEAIREILNAAKWAPSAHNAQPWQFIILTETQQKRRLAEAMANTWLQVLKKDGETQENRAKLINDSVERFTNAPVLVVACLTMKDMLRYPDEERQKCEHDLAVQSLSAAIQNMLLTAHAKQLGACWYCAPIFCKTSVRQALRIPEDTEPQALITIGYPAEKPNPLHRKPLRSIAHLDTWSKAL